MCAKPLKPILAVEEKPKPKEQPKAAAPKVEKVVEEKKLDNVQSLPPTSFDLFNFKTFYVNHPDKRGEAVDEWYKTLDWEGWAFWFLHYDKYEGEGEQLHVTNNLMNGFLNRAEHTSKYVFGKQAVLGDEPNLEIMGVWLMRGTVLPDGLVKEHPQFEYYRTRKLDPRNNADDDKLIRDFMAGQAEDTINGLKCQTMKWVK
jgi:elongation factor 1-gamma